MMGSLYGFHFHSGSAVIQSVSHYPRFVTAKPAQLKSLSQIMTREISNIVKIILYAPASRKLIVFSHPVVGLLVMITLVRSRVFMDSWNVPSKINQSFKKLRQKLLISRLPLKELNYEILKKLGRENIIKLLTAKAKEDSSSTAEDIAVLILAKQTASCDVEKKHLLIMEAERREAIAEADRLMIIKRATASIIDDVAVAVTQARFNLIITAKAEVEEKQQALSFEETGGPLIVPNEHETFISNPAADSRSDDATLVISPEGSGLHFVSDFGSLQDPMLYQESQIPEESQVPEKSQIPNSSETIVDSINPIITEVEAPRNEESGSFLPSMHLVPETKIINVNANANAYATLPAVGMLLMIAPFLYWLAQEIIID